MINDDAGGDGETFFPQQQSSDTIKMTPKVLSSSRPQVSSATVPDVQGAGRRGLDWPDWFTEELSHFGTLRVVELSRLHWITCDRVILITNIVNS